MRFVLNFFRRFPLLLLPLFPLMSLLLSNQHPFPPPPLITSAVESTTRASGAYLDRHPTGISD